MDSSEPSGQQTIVQNNDPWSGQQTYLNDLFKRAQDQSNTPVQQFPNSTVVPFSGQTNDALQMAEQRARAGSPTLQAGQEAIRSSASGEMLNPNPYLDNVVDAASRPLMRQFTDSVMPGIDANFSASGRYGSGSHTRAMEGATDSLGRSLADLSGGLAYQNYGDERNRQMAAAQLSPTMAQADYTDIGQLQNVGGAYESQAGAQLQDQINKFNYDQTEAQRRLGNYGALVAGGSFGGQSTSSQPIYSNAGANALGLAAGAAGTAATLFGRNGVWPGLLT
jgi:hypothetical protein